VALRDTRGDLRILPPHGARSEAIVLVTRSEILYLPHVPGTASFRYGQQSPVR
jgi:hypothetical protein